jgi:hypothetical protein
LKDEIEKENQLSTNLLLKNKIEKKYQSKKLVKVNSTKNDK